MSSKKPLLSSSNSHKKQFLQRNAAELDGIELFAELSEGFTIGFMEVNSDLNRGFVAEYFKNRDQSTTVQWVTIHLADENLQYFGLEVREHLQKVDLIPGRKQVLLISGLERSIGVTAEYPDVLVSLNMERDIYPRILPYPVIFLLPNYALARVAHYAPDFWAWKSIEVKLQSDINQSSPVPVNFYGSIKLITGFEHKKTKKLIPQSRLNYLTKMLAKHNEPTMRRAQLLRQIGDVYAANDRNDEAMRAYQSALDIHSKLPANFDQVNTLSNLAKLYYFQSQYLLALKVYKRALPIYRELGDSMGESNNLLDLSRVYEILGKLRKSLNFAKKSLKISQEFRYRVTEAHSFYRMSGIYCTLKKFQKAIIFAEKSLKIYEELDLQRDKANSLYDLSTIYKNLGELQKSLDFSEQSLKIDREVENQKGEADSLYLMSKVYYDLGELQKSLILSEQVLKIFKEIGSTLELGSISWNMSRIYCDLGELSKALLLAEQSLSISQEIGIKENIIYSIQQISIIHEKLGDLQKSLNFSEQALKICQEIGDKAMEETISHQLTRIQKVLAN